MNLSELTNHLRDELVQREEEGCNVAAMKPQYEAALAEADEAKRRKLLDRLYDRLAAKRPRKRLDAAEPSDLDAIRALRPDGPRRIELDLSNDQLLDRVHGGWLGRAAGCMLGKPVEGWDRSQIEAYLARGDALPLANYIPAIDIPDGDDSVRRPGRTACLLGNIQCAERDDDMDYPIIGLHILEEKGPDFTPGDVAHTWLARLPYHCVYTAERAAYRNLVDGLAPPESASYRNPYREWIGAQIRADQWGWVCPGRPEKAAELAFRDASISHVKNGICGEMFIAALLAGAFTTKRIHKLLRIGLSQIPRRCRLARAVRDCIRWKRSCPTWDDAWTAMMQKHGHYHRVHTINNAAIVVLALLYGEGDFGRTICYSVQAGLDTDCNGATAGSILGVMLGAARLPGQWTEPLNDRLKSIVLGFNDNRISDLARRSYEQAKRVVG